MRRDDAAHFIDLDPRIVEEMKRWGVPGLTIGIYQNGNVRAKAYGVANIETGERTRVDTVFGIGSISKVYTATLAMKLVELGLLELDEPVSTYVPSLRLSASGLSHQISLRHLLTHTSGLGADGFEDHGGDEGALARYVATFENLEQIVAPGTAFSYSNPGICLAGYVLAMVTRQSFETAMQELILGPLGLNKTGFGQEATPTHWATGYHHGPGDDPQPHRPGTTWRSSNPAGGMVSTVGDLLRFAEFHLGNGNRSGDAAVLSASFLRQMRESQVDLNSVESHCIGWAGRSIGGAQLIEHGGWMDGYRAQLTLVPHQHTAIALMNNGGMGHAANEAILKHLLAEVFDIADEDIRQASVPKEVLRSHAGQYRHSHIDLRILVEANRLKAVATLEWHKDSGNGDMVTTLIPVSSNEFVIQGGEFDGNRVVFFPSSGGRPEHVRFLNRVIWKAEMPDPESDHGEAKAVS